MYASLLDSRASFELAAFLISWIAVALLMFVVMNLYTRVSRLERERGTAAPVQPYSHLLGRSVAELIDLPTGAGQPSLLLFLSPNCGSCRRILEQLDSPSWSMPTALVWTQEPPENLARPDGAVSVPGGPRISADLGIRVTPFALVLDETGRTVQASPVNDLDSLRPAEGVSPVGPSVNSPDRGPHEY